MRRQPWAVQFAVVFVFCSFAYSQDFNDILQSDFPRTGSAVSLFGKAQVDPHLAQQLNEYIQSHPDLLERSEIGRKFQQKYIAQLREDFGDLSDLVAHPEQYLLSDLLTQNIDQTNRGLTPLTEARAAVKAWQETEDKFSYIRGINLNELEKLSRIRPQYYVALQFYKKRFVQLIGELSQDLQSPSSIVQSYKNKVIQTLYALRLKNLRQAFKKAAEVNQMLKVRLRSKSGNASTEISIDKLLMSLVHIEPNRAESATHIVEPIKQSMIKRVRDSLSNMWKTVDAKANEKAQDFYDPVVISANNPHHSFTIEIEGKHFVLSEASISYLLNEIAKLPKESNRYLTEAARRDAVLGDFIEFLNQANDRSVGELKRRLEISYTEDALLESCDVCTLSRQMTKHQRVTSETEVPLWRDLQWWGFSLHPDYWHLRDAVGQVIVEKKPSFLKLREMKLMMKYRLASNFKRLAYVAQSIAKVVAIAAPVALSSLMYVNGLRGLSDSQGEGKDINLLTLQEESEVTNHSFDLLGGPNGSRSGPTLFQIVNSQYAASQLPIYFNFVNAQSLPKGASLSLLAGADPQFVSKINVEPNSPYTFQIKTVIPTAAKQKIVPLAHPSGYRLINITVTNFDGHRLVIDNDFHLFEVKKTGMPFLVPSQKNSEQVFQYVASYVEENRSMSLEWPNIKPETILKISQKLEQENLTQVSAGIKSISNNPQPLGALIRELSLNSVYTYSPSKKTNRIKMSDFTNYDHFEIFNREGALYYQCTGSNRLGQILLEDALQMQSNTNIEILAVSGYARPSDMLEVKTRSGHMHLMAIHSDADFTYLNLDATPQTMDPDYVQTQNKNPSFQEYFNNYWGQLSASLSKLDDYLSTLPAPEKTANERVKAIMDNRNRLRPADESGKSLADLELQEKIDVARMQSQLVQLQSKLNRQNFNWDSKDFESTSIIRIIRIFLAILESAKDYNSINDLIEKLIAIQLNVNLQQNISSITQKREAQVIKSGSSWKAFLDLLELEKQKWAQSRRVFGTTHSHEWQMRSVEEDIQSIFRTLSFYQSSCQMQIK